MNRKHSSSVTTNSAGSVPVYQHRLVPAATLGLAGRCARSAPIVVVHVMSMLTACVVGTAVLFTVPLEFRRDMTQFLT